MGTRAWTDPINRSTASWLLIGQVHSPTLTQSHSWRENRAFLNRKQIVYLPSNQPNTKVIRLQILSISNQIDRRWTTPFPKRAGRRSSKSRNSHSSGNRCHRATASQTLQDNRFFNKIKRRWYQITSSDKVFRTFQCLACQTRGRYTYLKTLGNHRTASNTRKTGWQKTRARQCPRSSEHTAKITVSGIYQWAS